MKTQANAISLMPSDLPHTCPECGTAFRLRRNVKVIPGRLRRILERLANVGLWCGVIMLTLIVIFMYFGFSGHFGSNRGLGFGMMSILLGPYLAAEMLTSIARKTRLVACHRCGFSRTYPFRTRVYTQHHEVL